MPLPLLLAAGAGFLGGGQYLLSKMDEKREAGMLSDFRESAQGSALAQSGMADGLLQQIESSASNSTLLGRTAGQTQSLINDFQQADMRFQIDQAAGYAASGAAARDAALAESKTLQDDYRTDFSAFAEYQNVFGSIKGALEANDSANTLASTFNFFNLLEPGGIVRDSESGQYKAQGGASQQWANWLNEIQGKGLSKTTANQIWGAVQNQYRPRYEQAKRKFGAYGNRIQQLEQMGVNAIDPSGSQGINWETRPDEALAQPLPDAAPGMTVFTGEGGQVDSRPQLPPGLSYTNPNEGKRNPSVRDKRRR